MQQDSQWHTRRDEVCYALEVARATKALAQKIQTIEAGEYGTWGQKWEQESDLEIASFGFFVSCKGDVPARYRFAGEIDHPASLLREMIKTMKLFDVDVEPLYKAPEPVGETSQLALF